LTPCLGDHMRAIPDRARARLTDIVFWSILGAPLANVVGWMALPAPDPPFDIGDLLLLLAALWVLANAVVFCVMLFVVARKLKQVAEEAAAFPPFPPVTSGSRLDNPR